MAGGYLKKWPWELLERGAFGVCAGAIMPMMLMLLSAEITLGLLHRLYFCSSSSSSKVKNRLVLGRSV